MHPGNGSGWSVKVTRPTSRVRTYHPSVASPEPSGLQITTQCLSAEGLNQSATPLQVPVGRRTAKFFPCKDGHRVYINFRALKVWQLGVLHRPVRVSLPVLRSGQARLTDQAKASHHGNRGRG